MRTTRNFLYAASNLGSFVALLGYPLLMEPSLPLSLQNWVWSGGYVLLGVLTLGCAVLLWRSSARANEPNAALQRAELASVARVEAVPHTRRALWALLSFAPSSLSLGVTTYLTTDVAAIPLLWIVPLSLYLFTYVIVFARRPPLRHSAMVWLQPIVVLPLVVVMASGLKSPLSLLFPLHLFAFFVTTMVCHGELAKRRPAVTHLTEFYLWMSVGGVLGAVFNILVTPAVFDIILEYPLALALACALRPLLAPDAARQRWLDFVLPALLGLVLGGLLLASSADWFSLGPVPWTLASGVSAVLCFAFSGRPLRFGLGVGVVLPMGSWGMALRSDDLHVERTFFGVHKVQRSADGAYQTLVHGTTLHGGQSLDPTKKLEPLTYYTTAGPLGQVFGGLSQPVGSRRVALVGLGTGTIACYGAPGES